ncbi:Fe-S cluster assembly ATPase SufC [uncultured Clostridium sp.]|jgi:Fe-S cluster assembly ATP-binding protein|uniref:Fe-S cluster assembly ATPase SufC n=1 Tax=uncultured Clostridium sp. TaxID=59620 RepID=UPI0026185D2B|nr:Fe-S cluster assembly ATPase SufC [uncultured Clostridium sp.]
MNRLLEVKGLKSKADDKEILKGLDLVVNKGEVHVIMGPNGAGKSTLANTLMSHPRYKQTAGEIIFGGEDISKLKTDERAKKGLFLSFQTPEEIPGITVENFLKTARTSITGEPVKYLKFSSELKKISDSLKIEKGYLRRYLNVGFSGGEKKKNEVLQLLALNPKLAILDETDSGLDVDAVRIVSEGIKMFANEENAVLIITHNSKILDSLKVDYVHILVDGKIVKTGDASLANEIQEKGFEEYKNN